MRNSDVYNCHNLIQIYITELKATQQKENYLEKVKMSVHTFFQTYKV